MRYLINVFLVLILGAVGTAQAQHLFSTNPADWWFGNPGTAAQTPGDPNAYMIYVAPLESTIPNDATGAMIRYGKQILEETYKYLGPDGPTPLVASRLSCTNCHLGSGKSAYGQPWVAVWYKYYINKQNLLPGDPEPGQGPWSARSNRYLDMKNRIHDCTVRSMNGGAQLPNDSKEMLSMVAYMKWLSEGIKVPNFPAVGSPPSSANIWDRLGRHGGANVIDVNNIKEFEMSRAADPARGKTVYEENCLGCHGSTGEGIWDATAKKYIYPALWGQYSFNQGAGMYRLRTAVGFVMGNMPYGWANPTSPLTADPNDHPNNRTRMLSNEDSWDVMAYVLDQDRPRFYIPASASQPEAGQHLDWLSYRKRDNLNDPTGLDPLFNQKSECMPNWAAKRTQLDAGYETYYPRLKSDASTLTGNFLRDPQKYPAVQHKYGPWKVTATTTTNMTDEMKAISDAYELIPQATRPKFPDCKPVEFVACPTTLDPNKRCAQIVP